MASPVTVTFETVALDSAWQAKVDRLKSSPGVGRVFFGPVVEDPSKGVVSAVWSSAPPAEATTGDDVLTFEFPGPVEAAFEAPTTEIFTAFGAESSFYGNLKLFAAKIDEEPPKTGYFANAVGKNQGGDVLRLLIGWSSVQAHLDAKATPGGTYTNCS